MEHLWMAVSILQQLLPLYFVIIYNWQLSSSEKLLAGKKNSSIYFKDFTDLYFSYTNIFFLIFFGKCLFTSSVTQSVCFTLSSQPFCWLGDT